MRILRLNLFCLRGCLATLQRMVHSRRAPSRYGQAPHSGRGFHEKACLCQAINSFGRVNLDADRRPKGGAFASSFFFLRKVFCPSFPAAHPPGFHSHSLVERLLRCLLGFFGWWVLLSLRRTSASHCWFACSSATSQSPELGVLLQPTSLKTNFPYAALTAIRLLFRLGRCRFSLFGRAIPQRFVDFARHPQPMQQHC